jgi:hypothetical protein
MRRQLAALDETLGRLQNQKRFESLLPEISPAVQRTKARLSEVDADPAFLHLPDGKLRWNENYEALSAYQLAQPPKLDGDFSKWQKGPVYTLNARSQIVAGAQKWQGPQELSGQVALAWDTSNLYVGVDVTDPGLYQPFFGRGITKGDTFVLTLETAFRKNFFAKEPTGDEYALFFSPGNFADIKPSVFSDEDYLPRRAVPHDYMQEIHTGWVKTARGYSGDIAIPASYFAGSKLGRGYEIGLAFGVRKVLDRDNTADAESPERIELQSKQDHLFRATTRNPSSIPRLVLTEPAP